MSVVGSLWGLTKAVTDRVMRHSQMARSSQFAYVAFLASIPFAFVLIAIIGLVASPAAYTSLIERARGTIPDQLADFLDELLQAASSSTGQSITFLVLGLLIGLWLAGNVAGSITDGLDDAFERPHRPWLKGKVRAILAAVVTALVFVVATLLSVIGPPVLQWAVEQVGAGQATQVLVQVGVALAGAAIFWGFLVLVYRYAPNDAAARSRHALPGAVVGVIGWIIVASFFRLYVDNFGSYNRVYGSLGAVVIFLVFLYLTGLVILIGGETSAELAARDGADEVPDDASAGSSTAA
ncbi:MAG: YihY/virulence factor BrkB family protein [Actinomycetota bacterium]